MAEGLGEDGGDEDHFLTNYHLSSQYKREKFSQKLNGIILSTSAQEILSGGKVIAVNDYFFLKNIGHGSFGDVKLATKDLVEDDLLEDHQRFAVKMLKRVSRRNSMLSRASRAVDLSFDAELQQSVPEQVQKEIAIMKILVHPNLVQLLEIINSLETPHVYLVLEHMDGGPVMKYNPTTRRFVDRFTGTTMGEAVARRSYVDLLSGLSFMHSHHIAHRDLKPDNLLVDFQGNLKISDFGVSIHFEKDVAKSSISLKDLKSSDSRGLASHTEGTFPFFSPEMCGRDMDTVYSAYLADMWASAVCLWIFVFGQLPFYDPDLASLFDLIRSGHLLWPHALSPELTDFLTKALHNDPKQRLYIAEAKSHCWLTGAPLTEENSSLRRRPQSQLSDPPSVSLRQVLQLRIIARRIRAKCRQRRESLELTLKKDLNRLASSLLTQLTAATTSGRLEFSSLKLLKSSEAKEDEQNDDDSLCSDPLGHLVSKEPLTPSVSTRGASPTRPLPSSLSHDIPVASATALLDISRFSKLEVLNSIRDDELKRNSRILPAEVATEIKMKRPYQSLLSCALL